MQFVIDPEAIRAVVHEIVQQTLQAIDWPVGRLALTEAEAADACGVRRHVLRDLRLSGHLEHSRLGRKVVYTREHLLTGLGRLTNAIRPEQASMAKDKTQRRAQSSE